MPLYTVLAPVGGDRPAADAMDLVFVKEGFCWPALFVPELWLIFRRMWLVLLIDIAVIAGVSLVGERIGEPLAAVFLVAARLLFALEGNELRRWTMRRRGYALVGVAGGDSLSEAEVRFFSDRRMPAPDEPGPHPPAPPAQAAYTPDEAGEVVGLFPRPGGAS